MLTAEQVKAILAKPEADRSDEEKTSLTAFMEANPDFGKGDPSPDPEVDRDADGNPKPVPYGKFKEQREAAKAAETKLAELQKQIADDEEARNKAKTEADEAALAEQKKFEELAEKRKGEREEAQAATKAATDELDRYKSALQGYLEAARKDLPDHIIALLDKLDPVEQLAYITENQEALGAKIEGIPETPGGGSNSNQKLTDEQKRKAAAQTGSF